VLEVGECQVVQFNEAVLQQEMAELEGARILGVIFEDLMKGPALVKGSRLLPHTRNIDVDDRGAPSDQFGDVIKYFCVVLST